MPKGQPRPIRPGEWPPPKTRGEIPEPAPPDEAELLRQVLNLSGVLAADIEILAAQAAILKTNLRRLLGLLQVGATEATKRRHLDTRPPAG